jgi:hypothetical protein
MDKERDLLSTTRRRRDGRADFADASLNVKAALSAPPIGLSPNKSECKSK